MAKPYDPTSQQSQSDSSPSPKRKRKVSVEGEMSEQDRLRNLDFAKIPEESRSSILSNVAGGLWSGAEGILNVMSLPQSSVLDIAGLAHTGDFQKFNPFDQWLTPVSGGNRFSGREFLRETGYLDPEGEDTWGNFGLGLGLDIISDPLTFGAGAPIRSGIKATGSKLNTFTEALATPGINDSAITSLARQGIGAGREVADRIGLAGNALFDAPSRGSWTRRGQSAGKAMHAVDDTAKSWGNSYGRQMTEDFRKAGVDLNDKQTRREFLQAIEDKNIQTIMPDFLEGSFKVGPKLGGNDPDTAQKLLAKVVIDSRDAIENLKAKGIKIDYLNDLSVHYFPRTRVQLPKTISNALKDLFDDVSELSGGGGSARQIDITNPHTKRRLDFLEIGEGGTDGLNQITSDKELVGALNRGQDSLSVKDIEAEILNRYGGFFKKDYNKKNLKKLATFVGKLDEQYVDMGGFFNTNPIDTFSSYMSHAKRVNESVDILYSQLAETINLQNTIEGTFDDTGKSISLKSLLQKTGLNTNKGIDNLLNKYKEADPDGFSEIIQKGMQASGITDEAEFMKFVNKSMKNAHVNEAYANDLIRMTSPMTNPKNQDVLFRFAHNATSFLKRSLTGHFPAFHVRNYAGGQVQNAVMGAYGESWNPIAIAREGIQQNINAKQMMSGKPIEGISEWAIFKDRGFTDREATNYLIEQILDTGLIGGGTRMETGAFSKRSQDLAGILQGNTPDLPTLTGYATGNQRNVTALKNYFKTIGENAGDTVEAYNRIPAFLSILKREGVPTSGTVYDDLVDAARMAKDRVDLIQVDYGDLTPYEKDYARLIFPFYSFAKGSAKAVATDLWERPAGGLAQIIRMQGRGSETKPEDIGEGRVLPEYLRRTGAIPLGTDEAGNYRALTGFGLMHEQPMEMMANPTAEGLGMLNPLISSPIELGLGRSFFFDQPISQLDPTMGRIASNVSDMVTGNQTYYPDPVGSSTVEHLVSSSPASRYLSTLRTLTDPRKYNMDNMNGLPIPPVALNLLTGMRIADINPQRRLNATREVVNNVLESEGGRTSEYIYFPTKKEIDDKQAGILALQRYLQRMNLSANTAGNVP